jgi:5-methylcytosine-specific restriction endonuclease McrA
MSTRKPIPVALQAEVLFRDRWLCHLCQRPLVLHVALRLVQEFVRTRLPGVSLAYWDPRWRRDVSPLLDELAASIDHVTAHARGGAHDVSNFAAVCARCNARKSAKRTDAYLLEARPWRVRGKYGAPKDWDGLSLLFLALAKDNPSALTPTERSWCDAIEREWARRAGQAPSQGGAAKG